MLKYMVLECCPEFGSIDFTKDKERPLFALQCKQYPFYALDLLERISVVVLVKHVNEHASRIITSMFMHGNC